MLEEQLAADVAHAIVESAQQAGVLHVMSAQVVVGQMRQIDEMLFRAQLTHALDGTIASGAIITFDRPPLTMRCLKCGQVYPATIGDPATYDCPTCGAGSPHTVETGMELGLGEIKAMMPNTSEDSIANKMARAVEEAFGPVEKPANA